MLLCWAVLLGMYIEQQRTGKFFPDEGVVSFGDDTNVTFAYTEALTIEDLLDAIEQVESRGDPNAVCPDGCCIGAYQLTKDCVDDVNKSWGCEKFTYEDRLDKEISRTIAWSYMLHYVPLAYDTLESRARIHNSGPDGWRNDPRWFVRNRGYTLEDAVTKINNSIAYWELVKSAMEGGNE